MKFAEFIKHITLAETIEDLRRYTMPIYENWSKLGDLRNITATISNSWEEGKIFIQSIETLLDYLDEGRLVPDWYDMSDWIGIQEIWME